MIFIPNHSHHFEILYEDGDNKVIYCEECQAFHIYYGTISLDSTMSSMESLIYTLAFYLDEYQGKINPKCRCIEIDTPYHGFRLLLSTSDISQFGEMLAKAYEKFQEEIWKPRNN
ncbi:MAG: hypothetical protein AAF806_17565 [Bacteroidota bacterium]